MPPEALSRHGTHMAYEWRDKRRGNLFGAPDTPANQRPPGVLAWGLARQAPAFALMVAKGPGFVRRLGGSRGGSGRGANEWERPKPGADNQVPDRPRTLKSSARVSVPASGEATVEGVSSMKK